MNTDTHSPEFQEIHDHIDRLDGRINKVVSVMLDCFAKQGEHINERFDEVDKRFDGIDKRFNILTIAVLLNLAICILVLLTQ